MVRRPGHATLPLMLLLAALAALAAAAQAETPFAPFDAAAIDPRPGAPVPMDLHFIDQNGAEMTLGDAMGGKPALLAPVYYECPNICLGTLSGLFAALANAGLKPGEDYRVVAISIDPREGPRQASAALAEALERFPAAEGSAAFSFLTGGEAAIAALAETIGFRYAYDAEAAQYAHAAGVLAVAADGRQGRWLYGVAPEPTDLKLALVEAGDGRVGALTDRLLLLCYHYDPKTGRYGSLVGILLKALGGLTILLIGGLVGRALWRERQAA